MNLFSVGFILYLCLTPLLFTASYGLILIGNPFLVLGVFVSVFLALAIVQDRNYRHGNAEGNHGSLTSERMKLAQEKYIAGVKARNVEDKIS